MRNDIRGTKYIIYMTDIKLNIGLYQVMYEIYRPISGGICEQLSDTLVCDMYDTI